MSELLYSKTEKTGCAFRRKHTFSELPCHIRIRFGAKPENFEKEPERGLLRVFFASSHLLSFGEAQKALKAMNVCR